jgi:hypothetical protein
MTLLVEAATLVIGLGVALGAARLALGLLLALTFGRIRP